MSFGHDIASLVASCQRGLVAKHSQWPRVKLSEVADLFSGFPYESAHFDDAIGTPLLRIRDILPGRTETLYNGKLNDPRMFRVRDGDIVVGMDGDFNARIWWGGEALLNQRVCALRARQEFYSQEFLSYVLPGYLKLINDNTSSVTVKHLSSKTVQDTPLPYPPLAEQRRIVARIDQLFAEIAEGEAALAAARKDLETFRRALLKAAVTGELTKDWRAANQVGETGSEVLAAMGSDRSIRSGRKGHESRTISVAHETIAPWELPPNWAWAPVGEVGSIQLGRQRAPQHHSGDHMRPYMRVANVFEDRIDLSDVKEMNFTPSEFESYKLLDGDVLLNEGQTPDLLGRPAIWRNQVEDCCFQNTLIRFRPRDGITSEWALLVFRSYLHMKRFKRESQITTNIAHLSAGRFAKIEFPVPPPAEAAEIVNRVNEALASAADTLAFLDAEASDAARLKQSILKAAFEGRLVPQDPADEPASALLARISASAPSESRAKRGRTRKPSA